MTNVKRKRGRPPGSGERDDGPYLARIADLLVANPSMMRSAAMNSVLNSRKDWGVSDKTVLQRWRDKLSKREAVLMEDARKRAVPPPARVSSSGGFYAGGSSNGFMRYDEMTMKAMYQAQEYERIRLDAQDYERIRQIQKDLDFERMLRQQREIENIMRQQREIENMMRWSNPYRF